MQGGKGSGKGRAVNSRKSLGIAAVQAPVSAVVDASGPLIARVALTEGKEVQPERPVRSHFKLEDEAVGRL